jgi:hypothetical protein
MGMNEPTWTERIRARRELAAETIDGDVPPADRLCAHQPYPCVHCGKPTREVFFDSATLRPHARCRGACRSREALAAAAGSGARALGRVTNR